MAPSVHSIHVDAWKSDWHDDPLMALALATNNTLEKVGIRRAKDLGKRLVGYGLELAPAAAGFAANLAIPGSGTSVTAAMKVGTEAIKQASSRASAQRKFEEALGEARDLLLRRQRGGPIKGHVVVVVDELDRCRPDYAVRMLERIKHLYSLPGFVFVIATDNVNLRSAVKSVYGPGTDGEQYLRKFFDFELHLRPPQPSEYARVLIHQFGVDDLLGSRGHEIIRELGSDCHVRISTGNPADDWAEAIFEFVSTANRFRLSLRDQAQAFSLLYALMVTSARSDVFLPALLAYLACLRFGQDWHEDAFSRIKVGGYRQLQATLQNSQKFGNPGPYLKALGDALVVEPSGWDSHLSRLVHNSDEHASRLVQRVRTLGPAKLAAGVDRTLYLLEIAGSDATRDS